MMFVICFQIVIEPGEAKIPDHGGMFTSVEVRGIPLMIETQVFDKSHLIRLLGFDKPLNLGNELVEGGRKKEENLQIQDFKENGDEQSKDMEEKPTSSRLRQ